MRRIGDEFDIAQFLASALVRKIAANKFQLLAAERDTFHELPDDVIARIEQIVCEAYLEAGEDVGGDILREHLWQQALRARRDMVANGELISEADFRQRLGVTEGRLSSLLADGSLFTLEVDGAVYYPAQLADQTHNRSRLQAICRIIASAPADSRLGFLSSRRGSLGDRSPLDMLENDDDFKSLSRLAAAWAAEWSRTAVKMYEGEHQAVPTDVEPLYTAVVEIDPRRPLWERASEALHAPGYEWPLGPYPKLAPFTLFVERQIAGNPEPISEALVQISVDGESLRVRVVHKDAPALPPQTLPAGKRLSVVEVAQRVIAHLMKR
ncbi:hypothetical protein [Paraburkholderia humisilvae]|nr:hypothetical protein [Paraburkholderia humisilvae]